MEKKTVFTGAGVAIITPFDENGINFEAFANIIEEQIAQKTDAIIVCGTTGEASTMPDAEHLDAIRFAVKTVGGRVPVIAGTGSNSTRNAIALSRDAKNAGADGLLVVTPYYNKATQEGLIHHYTAIADAVELPMILYDVPSRTGVAFPFSDFTAPENHRRSNRRPGPVKRPAPPMTKPRFLRRFHTGRSYS